MQVPINIDLSSYIKNVINNKVKIFLKFETIPIFEEISGQIIQTNNDQPPFLEKSVYGNGLRLRPRSGFSMPLLLDNPSEFTLGFWLKPNWISPTISPATNLPVYYRMSLMDKSAYSYTSATGYVSSTNTTFCVYEESIENEFNVMKIVFESPEHIQTTIRTEPYKTGEIHHFWISYYGPTRQVNVFIDGVLSPIFSEEGLSTPKTLNNTPSVPFNINLSAVGYSSLIRNNSGLLDELVFFNQAISDTSFIARAINFGVENVIDQSLLYNEIVDLCFAFDDPTALGVSSVISNGKNFYAGRNDGVLFRGDRTMWQVRRDFVNPEEINSLKKSVFADDSVIDIQNGSLKLSKASVRI